MNLPWPAGLLARRSMEPELMDGPGLSDPALHARVLADLARVNRLTRTHVAVLQFVRQVWARHPAGSTLSVLDLGSGHGDLLRAIQRMATRLGRTVRLRGLDLSPDSTAAARAATPAALGIEFITGDLFGFEPGAEDCIVSSQLAHHLDDAQLLELLRWLDHHARSGWCIADLRRHWLPYLGFRWLARAAGWHAVVRIDGTRSIARACTPAEWRTLLARAGVHAQVRLHAPFRQTVQAFKPAGAFLAPR